MIRSSPLTQDKTNNINICLLTKNVCSNELVSRASKYKFDTCPKDNTTHEYAKVTKDSFTNFTVTTPWDMRIVS